MAEMSTLTVGDQEYEVVDASARASLSAKSDAGHTHSYSDIEETIPISKGGTGATTAALAKTNLGIDGLVLRTVEVPASGSVTIKFYSVVNALIMCTGPSSALYGSFVYNGYGSGGSERVHIAELQNGSQITYVINDVSSDSSNSVTITNANTNASNICYVSVLVLRGGTPTITTV